MSVLLANRAAMSLHRIASPDGTPNAQGYVGGFAAAVAVGAGRVRETASGEWEIALQPGAWPVRRGDVVSDGLGAYWKVESATGPRLHSVVSVADHILVTAIVEDPANVV